MEWKPGRLQVIIAMLVIAAIGLYSLFLGYDGIAGTCAGGEVALGMKLLEGE